MKVIVFGKCDRPRGPRPVELMNFNKIYSSLDSETHENDFARHTTPFTTQIQHDLWIATWGPPQLLS